MNPAATRTTDPLLLVGATREEHRSRSVLGADGSWITLSDGQRLLDMSGQYSCIGIGHAHPRIKQALHDAIERVDFVCELFSLEERQAAAELLVGKTMPDSDRWGSCRFVSSGSEAVEMAMVVARSVTNRPVVVVSDEAYHGWTAGASAATTLPRLQNTLYDLESDRTYLSPRPDGRYPTVPSPRLARSDEDVVACVAETERIIRRIGVENVAAFMYEIYRGSAGFLVPDLYVRLVREMTERLGILWIDDEAIAGAGRTGKWWAFQHTGVEPDIVVTAKGIGSSAAPAGAVIVTRAIADQLLAARWGTLSTNSGHPLAVAAIAATVRAVVDENVLDHVAQMGDRMQSALRKMAVRHPSLGSFSGRGLAWSLELVRDAKTGAPWVSEDRAATPDVWARSSFVPSRFVGERCEEAGVLLLTFLPNTITLAPPLRIASSELDYALEALDGALTALDERCAR